MKPFDPFKSAQPSEEAQAPFSPFAKGKTESAHPHFSPFAAPDPEQQNQTAGSSTPCFEPSALQTNSGVKPFDPFKPAQLADEAQPFSPFIAPEQSSPVPASEASSCAPYRPEIHHEPVQQPVMADSGSVPVYQPQIVSPEKQGRPVPATVEQAFSVFSAGEMSVKEKARQVLLAVFGPDCVHEPWFQFLLNWAALACKDGESAVKSWLHAVGDRNQQMHDMVTDLHRDYDLLDVIASIAGAHKMMSESIEKKWFKRSSIEPDKLEAHLSVIRNAIPAMQKRLGQMLVDARAIMQETHAVSELTQRDRPEFGMSALHQSAERIYLLHQSVSLLVPDLLLLEKELSQQADDVETLVTISLPLWRRKQSRV